MTPSDDPTGDDSMAETDDALLDELRELLGPRLAVPGDVVAQAKLLLPWRTVDADLAALTHDSLVHGAAALTRSGDDVRVLRFDLDGQQIEVEIDEGGTVVMGQLEPPLDADVTVLRADLGGETEFGPTVHTDPMGRFIAPLPGSGEHFALRIQRADGSIVHTARIRL